LPPGGKKGGDIEETIKKGKKGGTPSEAGDHQQKDRTRTEQERNGGGKGGGSWG